MTPDTFRLETDRLLLRPFVRGDLDTIHPILNAAFGEESRSARQDWLDWTMMNYAALAHLRQPPYGDRAVVLKPADTLIGAVGLVPSFGPFDTLPYFLDRATGLFSPEMGLFWVIAEPYRGQGYATEAARALINFAFTRLRLKRVVATTESSNSRAIAVMQRLGMSIQRNPEPAPIWFQVVGILDNPAVCLGAE
ncbi:MAG TPA: GNAT family N-acetyltransferase [Aggregatilineaceae bacterium]|nr:GNAT family N-acetyltransferase [Aggregatilineaceae bacterium]